MWPTADIAAASLGAAHTPRRATPLVCCVCPAQLEEGLLVAAPTKGCESVAPIL